MEFEILRSTYLTKVGALIEKGHKFKKAHDIARITAVNTAWRAHVKNGGDRHMVDFIIFKTRCNNILFQLKIVLCSA